MVVCSVCRAVKKKTSTSEVSSRIEELLRSHVNIAYCKDIKSHGSTICNNCKRNLFKISKGETVPAEWTSTVSTTLPSRSSPSSKSSSSNISINSSSPTTSSSPSSTKICDLCYGKLGKFFYTKYA